MALEELAEELNLAPADDAKTLSLSSVLKGVRVRVALKLEYSFLPEDQLDKIVPDVGQRKSKRAWEYHIFKARVALRKLALEYKTPGPVVMDDASSGK